MIAGKYAKLMQSPATAMAIGGLGAAGISLASNQGEDKSYGRQALESLGAGALGAGVGHVLPAVYARSAQRATAAGRNFTDELRGIQSPMGGLEREIAKARAMSARGMMDAGASQETTAKAAAMGIRGAQVATNATAALGGLGLATGLGGQIGGGVANLGNMAGLAIDPESPGSSNTQGSRMSMQPQMSDPGQTGMQSDIRAMRERQEQRDQRVELGNLAGIGAIGLAALGTAGHAAAKRGKR
jgi:hypothetical protein